MAERLRLFVSAGPDLEAEREIIGQAVARLPVSLGWIIKRTPKRGEPLAPALEAIRACDFYALLLSTDIRAPVGLELITAQRARKTILAFIKEETARTPAARVFARDAQVSWTPFHSGQELEFLIQKALARRILEDAASYAISPVEWETLSALVEQPSYEISKQEPGEASGAGGGGVIIAPGRDLPPDGVLVGESTNVEKRRALGGIPTQRRRSPELVRGVPTKLSVCGREEPQQVGGSR